MPAFRSRKRLPSTSSTTEPAPRFGHERVRARQRRAGDARVALEHLPGLRPGNLGDELRAPRAFARASMLHVLAGSLRDHRPRLLAQVQRDVVRDRRRPCRSCPSPSSRRTAARPATRRSSRRRAGSRRPRPPGSGRATRRPRAWSSLKKPAVRPYSVSFAFSIASSSSSNGADRDERDEQLLLPDPVVLGHLDDRRLHEQPAREVALGDALAARHDRAVLARLLGGLLERLHRRLVDDRDPGTRRARSGSRP